MKIDLEPDDDPSGEVHRWGHVAAAGWAQPGRAAAAGPVDLVLPWASVTKLVTALAVWVAVEEGTVALDEPAGPPGATLRHLLAHASGIAPDSDEVLAPPGTQRVYSNRGFEMVATHVSRAAGMDFATYAAEAVLEPLGMAHTRMGESAAAGASGPLVDLLRLACELSEPTLVSAGTWATCTTTAFPGLGGVLPGFGEQPDNAWGLGPEVRDHKRPHWTGSLNSAGTFGHFGRSGSFLWVDPEAGVAAAGLSEKPFGSWATRAWPAFSDRVVSSLRPPPP